MRRGTFDVLIMPLAVLAMIVVIIVATKRDLDKQKAAYAAEVAKEQKALKDFHESIDNWNASIERLKARLDGGVR